MCSLDRSCVEVISKFHSAMLKHDFRFVLIQQMVKDLIPFLFVKSIVPDRDKK